MIVSHLPESNAPAPPTRSQTISTTTVMAPAASAATAISTTFLSSNFITIPTLPPTTDYKTDILNQLKARYQCNLSAVVYVISSYTNLLEKDFERRRQIEELHAEITRLRSYQAVHSPMMRLSVSSPTLVLPSPNSTVGLGVGPRDSGRMSNPLEAPQLITHSALLENVFNYLQKEKWATYIISIEFKNFTDTTIELRFKIQHGKMQHRGERYLKNEQTIFIPPGKSEVLSFGKGDHTTYGVEVNCRLLSLHGGENEIAALVRNAMKTGSETSVSAPNLSSLTSSTIRQVMLHDDFYWYIPYKTARPCEFRDESKIGLDVHCLPARSQRNLSLKCMMFTYQFQWPRT